MQEDIFCSNCGIIYKYESINMDCYECRLCKYKNVVPTRFIKSYIVTESISRQSGNTIIFNADKNRGTG